LEAFATRLWGCCAPQIGRYGAFIDRLLAAPVVGDGLGDAVPDPEWETAADDLRRFPINIVDCCEQLIKRLSVSCRLSELFITVREQLGPVAADYLRLRAVAATAPDLDQLRQIHAEPILAAADDGTVLSDSVYWGADLRVGLLDRHNENGQVPDGS